MVRAPSLSAIAVSPVLFAWYYVSEKASDVKKSWDETQPPRPWMGHLMGGLTVLVYSPVLLLSPILLSVTIPFACVGVICRMVDRFINKPTNTPGQKKITNLAIAKGNHVQFAQ